MTTEEAFEETLAAIEELRDLVPVYIKPSRARDNAEIVEKYSGPERATPEKWVHVTFYPETQEQRDAIAAKARHLNGLGIAFDTGGCAGVRDWELDWSFRYTARPDGELEARRDQVEALITEVLEDHGDPSTP